MAKVRTGQMDYSYSGDSPAQGIEVMGEAYVVTKDASPESVATVLTADPNSDDGRSQWIWVRLPNGDLMLATFPQGDTYFNTERDHC